MRAYALLLPTLVFANFAFAQSSNNADLIVNTAVGNTSQALVFNTTPQAPVATSSLPGLPSAQIYTKPDAPTQARGIPLIMGAKQVCGVKWTRAFRGISDELKGNSGKTMILWNGFPEYQRLAKGSSIGLEEVTPPQFEKGPIVGVKCLGTVTVMTRAGSEQKTDFGTIEHDLTEFLFSNLHGIGKVKLLTFPEAVAFPTGVATGGSSFGIGGILGHLVSTATSGVVNPSFSTGNGTASPVAWVGATFLILAEEQKDGMTLNPADLIRYYGGQSYANGSPAPTPAVQIAPKQ